MCYSCIKNNITGSREAKRMAKSIKQSEVKGVEKSERWLLFFYSVPSRPVSNRMKIWRKLAKAGAVQIKGAVYVLPMNEEHYEFFQWLVSEVSSMGGEAAFTRIDAVDSMEDREIVDLFDEHKNLEYREISKTLEDLEAKVNSVRKGSGSRDLKALLEQVNKVSKSLEEALKTDFFSSKSGTLLRTRLNALNSTLKGLLGEAPEIKPAGVPSRKLEDYQGKIWVTRKKPFVDRMASAWLIKKFIDRKATFSFMDERRMEHQRKNMIFFDIRGGEFTHVGDMCTFEVLIKSFGLKDKALKEMAEIVHNLDVKDEKYKTEAKGLEDILIGIRKTAKDDMDALERGMQLFEMLYVSKS